MLFIKTFEEFVSLNERYETFNIVVKSRHKILYKAENLYFLLEELRTENVWDLSFGYLSNEALKFFYDSDFNEHFSFESTNEQLPFTITNLMCKILKDFFNNHSNVSVEIYGTFDAGETIIKDTSKRTRMYWRSIQREFDISQYNIELDGNTITIDDKVEHEDLVLTEAILPRYLRNKNLLYHSTKFENFIGIIESNKIYENTEYDFGVATSRNKDYIFGRDSYYVEHGGLGEIQLILDKTKLANNYKIKPFDWEEWKLDFKFDTTQYEDKIHRTINNIDKYIVGFHINKEIVSLREGTVNILKYLKNWDFFMEKYNRFGWILFDNNWKSIPDDNFSKKHLTEQYDNDNDSINLYGVAKWGLEGEYSSSGCWDDVDDIEDAIELAIEDFKLFLSKPYPIELGNIPQNPIIYRLVRLKNIKDLNINNLGISWFSNPKQIENPEFFEMLDYLKPFKNEKGEVYIIKGQTTKNNIDMKRTLWERSTQWWENEIVVLDDSNIKILSIESLNDKYRI